MKEENTNDLKNIDKLNIKLMNETKEIIKNLKLFIPKYKEEIILNENEFKVIQDFDDAQDYAYTQFDNEKDGYTDWVDVREDNYGDIYGEVYECENYTELNKFIDEITQFDFNSFFECTTDEIDEIQDDVRADLIHCIKARLIMGKNHEFCEKILKLYISGGWPCGWEGDWFDEKNRKNGRIIVYYPEKDE